MKLLLLDGYGLSINVDGSKLHIKNGVDTTKAKPEEYIFNPKRIDVDNIVIYGRKGNLSIDAVRWLIKHNVQISILDWNGKLLTTMLPPESVQVKTKFAQYRAYENKKLRLEIARKFLDAKFLKTQIVLNWLKERYSSINNDFSKELVLFKSAKTINEMMMVEGRIASYYWREFKKVIPKKFEFVGRKNMDHPKGASDQINALLNYGYSILEAECRKAINTAGLDVHVGFLHEMNIGKHSLAYDLQEPFRFLIDLAVISLVERNEIEKSDFIRTDNYNLRLKSSGAKKLISEINTQFNNKISYVGGNRTWSYVILLKARELTHYLIGKKKVLDFSKPNEPLERVDTEELRQKILDVSYVEWEKMGFSRGTLHYMKANARNNKPFSLNKHVIEKLTNSF
jgi:CRISP-associated protein Cas1